MTAQWKRCESRYGGHQCTRQAGHVERHHCSWREWGTDDE